MEGRMQMCSQEAALVGRGGESEPRAAPRLGAVHANGAGADRKLQGAGHPPASWPLGSSAPRFFSATIKRPSGHVRARPQDLFSVQASLLIIKAVELQPWASFDDSLTSVL